MSRYYFLLTTLTCIGMTATALADDDTLGEIVVTAQRR